MDRTFALDDRAHRVFLRLTGVLLNEAHAFDQNLILWSMI